MFAFCSKIKSSNRWPSSKFIRFIRNWWWLSFFFTLPRWFDKLFDFSTLYLSYLFDLHFIAVAVFWKCNNFNCRLIVEKHPLKLVSNFELTKCQSVGKIVEGGKLELFMKWISNNSNSLEINRYRIEFDRFRIKFFSSETYSIILLVSFNFHK